MEGIKTAACQSQKDYKKNPIVTPESCSSEISDASQALKKLLGRGSCTSRVKRKKTVSRMVVAVLDEIDCLQTSEWPDIEHGAVALLSCVAPVTATVMCCRFA